MNTGWTKRFCRVQSSPSAVSRPVPEPAPDLVVAPGPLGVGAPRAAGEHPGGAVGVVQHQTRGSSPGRADHHAHEVAVRAPHALGVARPCCGAGRGSGRYRPPTTGGGRRSAVRGVGARDGRHRSMVAPAAASAVETGIGVRPGWGDSHPADGSAGSGARRHTREPDPPRAEGGDHACPDSRPRTASPRSSTSSSRSCASSSTSRSSRSRPSSSTGTSTRPTSSRA